MGTEGMTCSSKWISSYVSWTRTDNASLVRSKASRRERQYRLACFGLRGPRSAIQSRSLEAFANYGDAACFFFFFPNVTVIPQAFVWRAVFRSLEPKGDGIWRILRCRRNNRCPSQSGEHGCLVRKKPRDQIRQAAGRRRGWTRASNRNNVAAVYLCCSLLTLA